MTTKYTYKEIWIIAYPILISLIMEQLIGMTDTAFLGRVGEVELGASAIAGVYYLAIFMMAFGFSIGAQILIASFHSNPKPGSPRRFGATTI
jgi:multidrug resistance protein, MATE family